MWNILRVNKSLPVVQTDVDEIYSQKRAIELDPRRLYWNCQVVGHIRDSRFSQKFVRNLLFYVYLNAFSTFANDSRLRHKRFYFQLISLCRVNAFEPNKISCFIQMWLRRLERHDCCRQTILKCKEKHSENVKREPIGRHGDTWLWKIEHFNVFLFLQSFLLLSCMHQVSFSVSVIQPANQWSSHSNSIAIRYLP